MNDVRELKRFGFAHARAQGIPAARYREVCGRIDTDTGAEDGSWAGEWTRAAEALARDGRPLDACGHYNLARFPYVADQARQEAQDRCVAAFGTWAAERPDIRRLELAVPGGTVRCWTSGLSTREPRPLLVVMGGIVSVKEQWAPLLARIGRLGLAGVVTELPGVGEHTGLYTVDSWRVLGALLDTLADRAQVAETYVLAMSFGGHLALRCAGTDPRVRGVVTAGAPVTEFFTDPAWQSRLPRVTTDTLAHLTGTKVESMGSWALTDDDLTAVDVPVYYVASRRDEITPPGDATRVRDHVRDAHFLTYDEDHASPRYAAETRAWIMLALLRLLGTRPVPRAVAGTLRRVLHARRLIVERVA